MSLENKLSRVQEFVAESHSLDWEALAIPLFGMLYEASEKQHPKPKDFIFTKQLKKTQYFHDLPAHEQLLVAEWLEKNGYLTEEEI